MFNSSDDCGSREAVLSLNISLIRFGRVSLSFLCETDYRVLWVEVSKSAPQ